MTKKVLCILLCIAMLFSLTGCSDIFGGAMFLFLAATGDDRAEKDEIIEFVIENEKKLITAIENNDFSDFENKGFIKDISANDDVIDFSCGGMGFGSATAYTGFYYAPDNNMYAIWCSPTSGEELTPSGEGYEWQEGDNRYYTENICGNFYYYEASF